MTAPAYNAALRRLSWLYGTLFFAIVLPGVLGALYLADRVAASGSWDRSLVFLALLPVDLAPVILVAWVLRLTDCKVGLRCPSCGHSLSLGRHVRRLLQHGGTCPRCGLLVVLPQAQAQAGAPPSSGSTEPPGHSGVSGAPPSAS